jgi:hypothetical protein
MGHITRERLYLEHHGNKAAWAEGDGCHAGARTRSLRGAGMTGESSAFRHLGKSLCCQEVLRPEVLLGGLGNQGVW